MSAGALVDRVLKIGPATLRHRFEVADYDLDATLDSGQAFRWEASDGGWEGVVGERWQHRSAKEADGNCEAWSET